MANDLVEILAGAIIKSKSEYEKIEDEFQWIGTQKSSTKAIDYSGQEINKQA